VSTSPEKPMDSPVRDPIVEASDRSDAPSASGGAAMARSDQARERVVARASSASTRRAASRRR
jgi:hypothetical protein